MTTEPIPEGCLPFDLDKALAGHPAIVVFENKVTRQILELKQFSLPEKLCASTSSGFHFFHIDGSQQVGKNRIYLVKPEPKKVKVWIPVSIKASKFEWRFIPPCESLEIAKKAIANYMYEHLIYEEYWQIIEAEIEVSE
jgi:hypothetical protein